MLPATQSEAAAIGLSYFMTDRPCLRGHIAPRYTKGGRCSYCQRERNAAKRGRVFDPDMSRAARAAARAQAQVGEAAQFVPLKPCKHGHLLRWASSNNCVECGKLGRQRHKDSSRFSRIKRVYGLSRSEYRALVEAQASCCAICNKHEPQHFALHVDHCHSTGKVRGLLCGRCNQALGLLDENAERMAAASAYVVRHAA